jgi:hypothetical protein
VICSRLRSRRALSLGFAKSLRIAQLPPALAEWLRRWEQTW